MYQPHSHFFQEAQNLRPSMAGASGRSTYPNWPTEGDHRRGYDCEDPRAGAHSTLIPTQHTVTLTAPLATDPALYYGPRVRENDFRDVFSCDWLSHSQHVVDMDPTSNLSGSPTPIHIADSGHPSTTSPFQPPQLYSLPYDKTSPPSLASDSPLFPGLPEAPSRLYADHTARSHNKPGCFRDEVGTEARSVASLARRSILRHGKTYTCAYCLRTCTRKRTLDDHMLRHKNLRQYQCDQVGCGGARFNTEGGLKSHLKKVHKLKLARRARSHGQ